MGLLRKRYPKELVDKVWDLYYVSRLATYEIARTCNISEYDVLCILGKN